jgi:hypothetical protein
MIEFFQTFFFLFAVIDPLGSIPVFFGSDQKFRRGCKEENCPQRHVYCGWHLVIFHHCRATDYGSHAYFAGGIPDFGRHDPVFICPDHDFRRRETGGKQAPHQEPHPCNRVPDCHSGNCFARRDYGSRFAHRQSSLQHSATTFYYVHGDAGDGRHTGDAAFCPDHSGPDRGNRYYRNQQGNGSDFIGFCGAKCVERDQDVFQFVAVSTYVSPDYIDISRPCFFPLIRPILQR